MGPAAAACGLAAAAVAGVALALLSPFWIQGDADAVGHWFAGHPLVETSRFFPVDGAEGNGAQLRQVRVGRETRSALLAREDRPHTARLRVPPTGGALELSHALACPDEASCEGSATFTLRAGERVLLARTLTAASEEWTVARVDLEPLAGADVTLSFALTAEGSPSVAALWGEPLLVTHGESERPNLILISLDTLRPDRLGCYGGPRPTSPVLDALAADGARFTRAISQAPWTTPSHMSLFTSLYPSAHGVNQGWAQLDAFRKRGGRYRTLPDQVRTLAQALRENGYRTLALTGGGNVAGELGFARGFDVYRESLPRPARVPERPERLPTPAMWLHPRILDRIVDWSTFFGAGDPFFLFFHTFEVHAPYTHAEFAAPLMQKAQRERFQRDLTLFNRHEKLRALDHYLRELGLHRLEITQALYDGGIRFTDAFLGRFFAALREHGLDRNTVVVVTSDHGEEFGDHDPQRIYDAHCDTLYDELIRVPLLVRAPGRVTPGTVVPDVVELIDVAPTLLELAGLPVPEQFAGQSLIPLLAGGHRAPDAAALSEATCPSPEWKSIRTADAKYISAFDVVGQERSGIPGIPIWEKLFDLRSDPGERRDLLAERPGAGAALRGRLTDALGRFPDDRIAAAPTRTLSRETEERLRLLGYLE